MTKPQNIVLLASGNGSNVQSIIDYFRNTTVTPAKIITNNPHAGVLKIAEKEHISHDILTTQDIASQEFIHQLQALDTQLIILAGYLKKIPSELIAAFPDKIINIHPALLPKYGGKGMYGIHVHNKVVEMKENETGITIHYINERYDEGQIILQARCSVLSDDKPETVAKKVLKLEHFYYPRVIEFLLGNSSEQPS